MPEEREEVNLERALSVLRRRAPWTLLCVVLAVGAAFAISKQQTKEYTATSSLVFGETQVDQQIAGLQPTANNGDSSAQQATNVQLVQLGDTAARTASLLGQGLTEGKVKGSLSISSQANTNVVNVSATSTSPQLAAAIANTYSTQFVKTQRDTNERSVRSALALVNKRLAALTPQQRSSPIGLALEERAQSLAVLNGVQPGGVHVAQTALVPSSPSSPKVARNVIVGAVLGLLIGIGIAFLLERLDRRIREPKDLEAIYGLPLLGTVRKNDAIGRLARREDGRDGLPPGEAEAFRMIRAHMHYFNVDRTVRTLLVISPAPGDGKTTVARYLAEAEAAARPDSVLLMESDLRAPMLAQQLAIEPGPGLADVLSGGAPLTDAIQSTEVGPYGEYDLNVLVAGPVPPPNPGELLESQAMQDTLEAAKHAYDYIVIDTSPLAVVADAFPLLSLVDGIIIVGRVGRHRREAEQLHEALQAVEAPLLGVIANGVDTRGLAAYAYGYYGAGSLRDPLRKDGQASESSDVDAKAAASNHDK